MPHFKLKSFIRAGLAILTGALLTTGGVSLVEADSDDCWHHTHTITASTEHQAKGKCASGCSTQGHSDSKVERKNWASWECECRD